MKEIEVITSAMLDKKAQNVCSLDLRSMGTAITDYFVICNADSGVQVNAICSHVEDMMEKECKTSVKRAQGKENGFWVILDYVNVVVHIFMTEYREFYRLEDLWKEAELKEYN